MNGSSHNESIAYFLAFCIEIYKNAHSLTGEEASQLLAKSGAINYLEDNYEILHTQNHHWLLEEIENFLSTSNNNRN